MKRYNKKFQEDYEIEDTKENREMFIKFIAEDYAKWMSNCHSLYIGHDHAFDFKVSEFMKQGIIIAKGIAKVEKTASNLHNRRESILDDIFRMEKRLK